jgi:hypothetical protein
MSTVENYPIYSLKNTLSLLKYFWIFIKLMTIIRIFSVVFNGNNANKLSESGSLDLFLN